MEDFFTEPSFKENSGRAYNLRLSGIFRTISLMVPAVYVNFRILNLNVFWIPNPDKKLG